MSFLKPPYHKLLDFLLSWLDIQLVCLSLGLPLSPILNPSHLKWENKRGPAHPALPGVFSVNRSFYCNVEFFQFLFILHWFLFITLWCCSTASNSPFCSVPLTRGALGPNSWLDLSAVEGWEKFKAGAGVSNNALRTREGQNVHIVSRGTCRLNNYFLMQSDLHLLPTNLGWAAKTEVLQMPSLHWGCADLWPKWAAGGCCSLHTLPGCQARLSSRLGMAGNEIENFGMEYSHMFSRKRGRDPPEVLIL